MINHIPSMYGFSSVGKRGVCFHSMMEVQCIRAVLNLLELQVGMSDIYLCDRILLI